jgi:Lon protease-like protein
MALLMPGWEKDYQDSPPVFSTITLGRIVKERRNADGTFDLLLFGLRRARIVEELSTAKPYRSAQVELVQEEAADKVDASWVHALTAVVPKIEGQSPNLPVEVLVDLVAGMLLKGAAERQKFLEESNVAVRARLLAGILGAGRRSAEISRSAARNPAPN